MSVVLLSLSISVALTKGFIDKVEGLDYQDWATARDKDENPSHNTNRPPPPIRLPDKFVPPEELQLHATWGCCIEDDLSASNNVPRAQKKKRKRNKKAKEKKAKKTGEKVNPKSPTERDPVSLLYKFTNFLPDDVKVCQSHM